MDQKFERQADVSLNLKEFFNKVVHKWYLSATIILVCVAIAFFYTTLLCTPLYETKAKLYIFNNSNTTGQVSSGELVVSTYFTSDYIELVLDRVILDEVIKELDLNWSYGTLKSCVSVFNPENTRFIHITVRTPDPELSKRIADTICTVSQVKFIELINVDRVNIIGEAALPKAPCSPNLYGNVTFGFLIGFALSVVLMTILTLKDDAITGVEDVEKYLQLSVLGIIPYSDSKSAKATYYQKGNG